jgi:prepilin-type N-terminal cleavage/methylation domain-containing protein
VDHSTSSERGVTLIEIMLALMILSIVLMALAGLMFQVARQTRGSTAATFRAAAVQQASTWVEAIPWDNIAGEVGCTPEETGLLEYTRCLSYTDSIDGLKKLTVVIAPSGIFTALPESLTVYRSRRRGLVPFQ